MPLKLPDTVFFRLKEIHSKALDLGSCFDSLVFKNCRIVEYLNVTRTRQRATFISSSPFSRLLAINISQSFVRSERRSFVFNFDVY